MLERSPRLQGEALGERLGGLMLALSGLLAATWGLADLAGLNVGLVLAAASAASALGASIAFASVRSPAGAASALGSAALAASIAALPEAMPAAVMMASLGALAGGRYKPLAALALAVALAGSGLYVLGVEAAAADYRLSSGLSAALAGLSWGIEE